MESHVDFVKMVPAVYCSDTGLGDKFTVDVFVPDQGLKSAKVSEFKMSNRRIMGIFKEKGLAMASIPSRRAPASLARFEQNHIQAFAVLIRAARSHCIWREEMMNDGRTRNTRAYSCGHM